MPELKWHESIQKVEPHVVKISTPQGSGTGFLIYYSKTKPMCAIATAAHVVDHAYYWVSPIRIHHFASGQTVLLREKDRAIILDEVRDTATIIFSRENLPLPDQPLPLIAEKKTYQIRSRSRMVGVSSNIRK